MKKFLRILITLAVVIGLIAIIGFTLTNNKKKNDAKTAVVAQTNTAVAVKVVAATKQPLSLDFMANGKFAAGQEIKFSAETAGRVLNVMVDEGDYVKKGQTLAVIKTENLAVDVRNAEDAYQNALRDKQRYENAYETGGVTRQQVDQATLALRNAEAKMELAKIKESDAHIRASINGIINKRLVEPGSVLAAGTQLFEIVDVSTLTLDIAVDESQVANLAVGSDAVVKASVVPDREFAGKIDFIAPKADENLNFPVKIRVKNNAGSTLKAGMYGIASFQFKQQQPAMLIPRSAFIGSVSSNQVFVADENNVARTRKLVTGRIVGDKVEIVSGLQEGEKLIVSGQVNLTDGTAVNILQ